MTDQLFAAALNAFHLGKWVRYQGEHEMESGELLEVEHFKNGTRICVEREPYRGAGEEQYSHDLRHIEAVFIND